MALMNRVMISSLMLVERYVGVSGGNKNMKCVTDLPPNLDCL